MHVPLYPCLDSVFNIMIFPLYGTHRWYKFLTVFVNIGTVGMRFELMS